MKNNWIKTTLVILFGTLLSVGIVKAVTGEITLWKLSTSTKVLRTAVDVTTSPIVLFGLTTSTNDNLQVLGSMYVLKNSTLATTTISSSTITFLNVGTVTSSNYILTGVASQCLQTDSNGKIAGTGSVCGSGGGGGGGVNTSTINYFTFYSSATAVTGTAALQLGTNQIIFTNATGTSATSTNLYVSGLTNLASETVTTSTISYLNATNVTSTQINVAANSLICFGTSMVSTTGECVIENNGQLFVTRQVFPNQTSSVPIALSDPPGFAVSTAANTSAFYSDALVRWVVSTLVNGVANLRNSTLINANQLYYGNATLPQVINATALFASGSNFTSIITYQGYHYAFVASSSYGTNAGFILRATSSPNINLALAASWVTTTISGIPVTSTSFIAGASNLNGSPTIWIASSTVTTIVPYTVNTANNTLTSGTSLTITGGNMLLNNTRVNENAIWVGFGGAPTVRKYDFSGNLVGGTNGFSSTVPSATGPDFFVTPFSQYLLGGAATYISRFSI